MMGQHDQKGLETRLKERRYWLEVMDRICSPVLKAMSERQLKKCMPVERKQESQLLSTHLEALSRTLVGIAPWLELEGGDSEETELRKMYREYAVRSIDAATNPDSADFIEFSKVKQSVVDAAFLSQAILRAPNQLWHSLEPGIKTNLVNSLKATRAMKPEFSNWLLFSATIEVALRFMGEIWDPMRVDYALKQHEQWYVGDGTYSDGPQFHWDYYNSFVIHPMLVDIVRFASDEYVDWANQRNSIITRAQRYSEVLERLISPDGTFPPIGRSLAYRFGAFHLLAQMALLDNLPPTLPPAQVRSALSAVIRRVIELPGTFDENGWLKIGFCGSQPDVGECYISTGSLYLCTTALMPLGLPTESEFWAMENVAWTSQKAWAGCALAVDHAKG